MQSIERLEEALTSKKWKFEFIEQSACPGNISAFFLQFLPHLPVHTFKQRLELGGFYVNGICAESDIELKAPCKVEYYEPKFDIEKINNVYPGFSKDWVLYEDEYLLIVYKPNRLPCLPTKEQKLYNLKRYIEQYCSDAIHMPSRLDTSTQGLVVMSRHPLMHNYLQKAFERKIIIKRYLTASSKNSEWTFKSVNASITKSESHAILRKITENDGKKSLTIFSKILSSNDKVFYLARPLTGRTHQIRLHSSHSGIPILGDNFYGGERADCLHLLSYQLEFWHPYRKHFIEASVPYDILPEWALEAFK